MAEPNSPQNSPQTDFFEPIESDMPIADDIGPEADIPEELDWDAPVDAPQPVKPQGEQPVAIPKDPQDPEGKRFSYWQSEAARAQNALRELQTKMQEVDPYVPIIRYIQENPQILDTIESTLGETQQASQGLKRPQPPARPASYNAVEALNDPESESFKFREANEQYREQLSDYLLKMEDQRQQDYERALEERRFVEQRNSKLREVNTMLTTQYGLTQQDAAEFIQLYSDPKNVTLDNLVQLYKIQKGTVTPQTNPKVQQMLQRQARNVPLPAGVGGGENPPALTDEDIFNESLARQGRMASTSVLWRNKPRK